MGLQMGTEKLLEKLTYSIVCHDGYRSVYIGKTAQRQGTLTLPKVSINYKNTSKCPPNPSKNNFLLPLFVIQ